MSENVREQQRMIRHNCVSENSFLTSSPNPPATSNGDQIKIPKFRFCLSKGTTEDEMAGWHH